MKKINKTKNIFEIQFINLSFKDILGKLKSLGDFQFINDIYYLSTPLSKKDIVKKFSLENIKKINTITKSNYNTIKNISCQQWCQNIFLENVKIEYEKNNQEHLQKLNKDLDFLLSFETKEELQTYIMKQIYNNKAGGDIAEQKSN